MFVCAQTMSAFENVMEIIDKEYIYELDKPLLLNDVIQSMLNLVDPYSGYFNEEETTFRDQYIWKGESYAGLGISINKYNGKNVIWEVNPDYDGAAKGLSPGDIIYAVNDIPSENIALDSLVQLLRGEEDSFVDLKIGRNNQIISFRVKRMVISDDPIATAFVLDNNIGYIKLKHFLLGSSQKMELAMQKIGGNYLKGLILDLRGNYGGVVEEALSVANQFIPKGKFLLTFDYRDKNRNKYFISERDALYPNIPIVILIDSKTISSGELLTGIFQDLDRGFVIGDTTYGKGIVQGTRYCPDGASLYLTIAQYLTPSGRSIQKKDFTTEKYLLSGANKDLGDTLFYSECNRPLSAHSGIIPDIFVDEAPKIADWISMDMRTNPLVFELLNNFTSTYHFNRLVDLQLNDIMFEAFFDKYYKNAHSIRCESDSKLADLKESFRKLSFSGDSFEEDEVDSILVKLKQDVLLSQKELIKNELFLLAVNRIFGNKSAVEANFLSEYDEEKYNVYFDREYELLNCKE